MFFFISNSSFYMFLLTYMYQKLKNIYIFKKSLRDSLPNRELLKMVAPAPASAPASAPAPCSRYRSQVTLVLSELPSWYMLRSQHVESTYSWTSPHTLDWCQEFVEIPSWHNHLWVEIHCWRCKTTWIYRCWLGTQCGGPKEHFRVLFLFGICLDILDEQEAEVSGFEHRQGRAHCC